MKNSLFSKRRIKSFKPTISYQKWQQFKIKIPRKQNFKKGLFFQRDYSFWKIDNIMKTSHGWRSVTSRWDWDLKNTFALYRTKKPKENFKENLSNPISYMYDVFYVEKEITCITCMFTSIIHTFKLLLQQDYSDMIHHDRFAKHITDHTTLIIKKNKNIYVFIDALNRI